MLRKSVFIAGMLLLGMFAVRADNITSNATTTMPFKENLSTPPFSTEDGRKAARHMTGIRKKFEDKGFQTEGYRNDEVIKITIPASQLFDPNETHVRSDAETLLSYFKQAVMHPEAYRIVVAVFADDTGDDEYSLALTAARAESIRKVMNRIIGNAVKSPNIDYYWFGNTNYVAPNNTIANRAKNRRVEIYLIPEKHLISN